MYYVGIDIGGTGIKAGIVNDNGEIVARNKIVTDIASGAEKIINDIANQVFALAQDNGYKMSDIKAIGVGCPGAINSKTGVVDYSNNLYWEKVPLASMLEEKIGKKVKVSNDANVATLGESKVGAGKNYSDVILITLGTGVGGGVVIDNKLFEGNESKGAEFGHTVIIKGGEPCTCGRRGCLEVYASATALIRETKIAMNKNSETYMWKYCNNDIETVNGLTAFESAKKGDKVAQEVVNNYIECLGEGLVNFVNVFRPQAIMLGGGVSAQGEYLTKPLNEYVKTNAYGGEKAPAVDVVIASLGNDAGIIGAASLVIE